MWVDARALVAPRSRSPGREGFGSSVQLLAMPECTHAWLDLQCLLLVTDRIRSRFGDQNCEVEVKSQVNVGHHGVMNQRSEQIVLDYLSEVGMALYGRMTAKER